MKYPEGRDFVGGPANSRKLQSSVRKVKLTESKPLFQTAFPKEKVNSLPRQMRISPRLVEDYLCK